MTRCRRDDMNHASQNAMKTTSPTAPTYRIRSARNSERSACTTIVPIHSLSRTSGARLRKEYLERAIPLEVEAAYQGWRTALDSLQLLQRGVLDQSEANLSVIRGAYKLGQLRLLDVINEQRRLIDTQMQFIDAQADVARTWAELERASGGNLP